MVSLWVEAIGSISYNLRFLDIGCGCCLFVEFYVSFLNYILIFPPPPQKKKKKVVSFIPVVGPDTLPLLVVVVSSSALNGDSCSGPLHAFFYSLSHYYLPSNLNLHLIIRT